MDFMFHKLLTKTCFITLQQIRFVGLFAFNIGLNVEFRENVLSPNLLAMPI